MKLQASFLVHFRCTSHCLHCCIQATGLVLAVRCCEFSCFLTRQPLHSNNQNVQSTLPFSGYGASMLTNSISCIVEYFQFLLSLLHTCMNATWSQEHFSENCSELLYYISLISFISSFIHSFMKLIRQFLAIQELPSVCGFRAGFLLLPVLITPNAPFLSSVFRD